MHELQIYAGYSDADLSLLDQFHKKDDPKPGFITDFLGIRTRVSLLWDGARQFDGQRTPVPVPADFHAETIEWIGVLKAVRSARSQFVMMELGAGFGPWSVAGGVAARHTGICDIRLCAVEADPAHFQALRQHLVDNDLNPDRHILIEAAVGCAEGVAQWPIVAQSRNDWGFRPMTMASDYMGREFAETRPVRVIAMRDLVQREQRWDLVHIDIQGDEVEVCRSCLEDLSERVAWLVVGTHSRKIDGDLLELMHCTGWQLEHEKPTKFNYDPAAPTLEAMATLDGTQVWRNPRLTPPLSGLQTDAA